MSSSSTSLASKRRLRMRQWLTLLLDRGATPGIRWEDKASAIFRIDWKHGSRHGYSAERDALVFRNWAEYTGKVDNKSAPDPKRWKANFRCALNSLKDVVQLSGKHSRGVHAFRLYQFTHRHAHHATRQPMASAGEKRCSAAPFRCTRDVVKMEAMSTDDDSSHNLATLIKMEQSYESLDEGYHSSSRRSLSESSDASATADDDHAPPPYGHFYQPDSSPSTFFPSLAYSATVFIQENTPLPSFQRWMDPLPVADDLDILNIIQTDLANFNNFNEFPEVR